MKKSYLLSLGIILLILIGGCSITPPDIPMDKLSSDGKFHYTNKELDFEIVLPEIFEYYQVQRKNTDEYFEIDFFVPTSDTSYPQEVQSYAKPLVLRFYDNDSWNQLDSKPYIEDVFIPILSNDKGKYFLKFWKTQPNDWKEKWNQTIEEEVKTSFKLL